MTSSHFSYLLSGQQQPTVSAERLELFAKTAAKRYIQNQVPLNDTISKLAEENDLNSHQIERVCEIANIATHQAPWPSATDKVKVAFPLANARMIPKHASKDHKPETHEKAEDRPRGHTMSDYATAPKGLPRRGPPMNAMMGVDPSKGHDGLKGPSERQRVLLILEKKGAERKRLHGQVMMAAMECETVEKLAFAMVKQAVLGGASFQGLYRAADEAGLGEVAGELLPPCRGAAHRGFPRLHPRSPDEDRHLARARGSDQPQPRQRLSDQRRAPVLVSLDTVQKKNGVVKNLLQGLVGIDDEIRIHNQKLRELS
jgi:hypothetical protein